MDEREALIALNLVPSLHPRRLHALIHRLGSAVAVWRAPAGRLIGIDRITEAVAQRIVESRVQINPAAELAQAQQHGLTILTRGEDGYPPSLAAIHDPPPVLYLRGALLPQDAVAVAIVGSRRASHYGLETAQRLAGELASRGVTIISGLARGIDAAAHRGALQAGGRTLAVLGSGLLRVYPPEHAPLAAEVAASGALISEFPLETPPLAQHFPRRNRLLSGFSLGVVVVEAADKSGALITADLALEEGREVFAVPGKVTALTSRGTNALLRDGATLVTSGDDILESLGLAEQAQVPARRTRQVLDVHRPAIAPSHDEAHVLRHLTDEPQTIDEIAQACAWPAHRALSVLTELELRRSVTRLPGQQYVKA